MNYDKNIIITEIRRADAEINDAFDDDVMKERGRVSKHAFESLRIFVAYVCKGVYFIDNDIKEDFISEKVEKSAVAYCRSKCSQLCKLYDLLNNTFMHVPINDDESIRLYFALRDLLNDVQVFTENYFSEHFLKPFDNYPENMDDTLKKYYYSVYKTFENVPIANFEDGSYASKITTFDD
jgi:hypothetical protein